MGSRQNCIIRTESGAVYGDKVETISVTGESDCEIQFLLSKRSYGSETGSRSGCLNKESMF